MHMNILKTLALTAACFFALATQPAYSADAPKFPAKKALGVVVTNAGMTLYTFDKDTAGSGKSVCNDTCATNWPPFAAENAQDAGPFSVITRDDGSKQWALKGKPLYLYSKDEKPGDMNGDNFNDMWHIIVQ